MRKTKKFLLIIIIVFLAICQVNNNVYSYKWKEVEELIDYEELEADQTPEKYDIEIDASKLIDNEKLPCIQTSIDTVLYEDNELSDIDFFDIRSKNNTNEALSDMVKTTFRVTLYLAAACLLTLLIYIAINMVTSSISPKFVKLPFGAKMIENKNKSPIPTLHDPNKNLRGRIAIEQWIVTVLLLAIILPLINLMIGFSYIITDATNVYSSKKDSDEDIIVYVRNANSSATTSGSGTNSSNGVTVSSSIKTESSEGDGYVETITLGERTFKLYKQNYYGSYINNYYYSQPGTNPPYTYSYQGCGPTALAIALSGYGINKNPEGIGQDLLKKDTPSARIYLAEEAKNLGLGAKVHTYNSNYTSNYNNIKTALASGHTIVLYVGEGGEGYHKFANGGAHYIAVLGIDTGNDKVFVGNPNVQYFNGWTDLSTVVKAMGDNIPHMSGWIEIYGENSQTEISSGSSSSTTYNSYMFLGDSRTVGMKNAVSSDDIFICKEGEGYSWMMSNAFPQADEKVTSGMAVVIWFGVNDMLDNADNYIKAINEKAKEWKEKGAGVFYVSVGPISEGGYVHDPTNYSDQNVAKFNEAMKNGLSSDVIYVDIYSKLKSDGFETTDGLHYTADSYKKIYNLIKEGIQRTKWQ